MLSLVFNSYLKSKHIIYLFMTVNTTKFRHRKSPDRKLWKRKWIF